MCPTRPNTLHCTPDRREAHSEDYKTGIAGCSMNPMRDSKNDQVNAHTISGDGLCQLCWCIRKPVDTLSMTMLSIVTSNPAEPLVALCSCYCLLMALIIYPSKSSILGRVIRPAHAFASVASCAKGMLEVDCA